MRKTPAALLAACSLSLGLWACGGAGSPSEGDGQQGLPDNAPRVNATAASEPGQPAPIGVQPVADTPVADLPSHEGHSSIAEPSPQPGVAAPAPEAASPRFTREWVVGPSGNDSGDGSAAQPFRSIAKAISRGRSG